MLSLIPPNNNDDQHTNTINHDFSSSLPLVFKNILPVILHQMQSVDNDFFQVRVTKEVNEIVTRHSRIVAGVVAWVVCVIQYHLFPPLRCSIVMKGAYWIWYSINFCIRLFLVVLF